jgi:hypothetical protein
MTRLGAKGTIVRTDTRFGIDDGTKFNNRVMALSLYIPGQRKQTCALTAHRQISEPEAIVKGEMSVLINLFLNVFYAHQSTQLLSLKRR